MRRLADFEFPASVPQPRLAPVEASKTLAGVLLSAAMAALLVVADQVIENWADGHLLLGWVALWSLVFAGLAFSARPLRRASTALAQVVHFSERTSHSSTFSPMVLPVTVTQFRFSAPMRLSSPRMVWMPPARWTSCTW